MLWIRSRANLNVIYSQHMKIQVLTDNLVVPDYPAFYAGQTYDVGDALAHQLIERMQAVPVQPEQPTNKEAQLEEAPTKKGKRQASN